MSFHLLHMVFLQLLHGAAFSSPVPPFLLVTGSSNYRIAVNHGHPVAHA